MITSASIYGEIQGDIWMPSTTCVKHFDISEDAFLYSDGSRPTLRDMVLKATNDGDFQSANISWGFLRIEMTRQHVSGHGKFTRTREFDLRKFPSIADCIVDEDDIVEISIDDYEE